MPKLIVFDKGTYFKNLNNWTLVRNDFDGLDYTNDGDDGANSDYYEFEMVWRVNGELVYTWVEIVHTWVEHSDEGDYYTPPSYEIVHEDIDVYVIQIWDRDDSEYDLGVDANAKHDLCNRLSHLIHDMLF